MSEFVPSKQHLREVLLFCFHSKKSGAESRRMLQQAYGDSAPSHSTCEKWFARFRSGNFDTADRPRSGQPKKFEDVELEALLKENSTQTQVELANALNVDQTTIGRRLRAGKKKLSQSTGNNQE